MSDNSAVTVAQLLTVERQLLITTLELEKTRSERDAAIAKYEGLQRHTITFMREKSALRTLFNIIEERLSVPKISFGTIDDVLAKLRKVKNYNYSELTAVTKYWRHKKRGTTYVEMGRGALQASNGPISEGAILVSYSGEDGKLHYREVTEFEDGRFERV